MNLEGRCGHDFHKGCIGLYLTRQINTGITQLQCPTCKDIISDRDIQKLVNRATYEKHEKQLVRGELMKSGINFVDCPACGIPFESAVEGNVRIVKCVSCAHT